jgi:MFS family permease
VETERGIDPPALPPTARESLGAPFWKLIAASSTSNMGDGIRALAFAWLASTLTRDPILVSGVAASTQLPWLVFTMPAGVVIDRFNRRLLMVTATVTHVLVGLLLASLYLSGSLSIGLLFPLALLTGCAEVIVDTTAQTLLGAVVTREQLVRASGLLVGAEVSMQALVGRPLGGFLASLSIAAALLTTAGLLACSTGALLSMPAERFRPPPRSQQGRTSWVRDLVDGLRWLWRHRLLRDVGIIIALSNVLYGATTATFVLFAREILQVDAFGFGVMGSMFAIGGVLASTLAAALARRLGDRGTFLLVIFATAFAFALVGLTSSTVVTALMLTLVGAMFTIWEAVWRVMRIRLVPDELLGRVTGVLRWLEMGPFPLASMLGGLMVALGASLGDRRLGLHLPYVMTGVVFVLLGFLLYPLVAPDKVAAAEAEAQRTAGPGAEGG